MPENLVMTSAYTVRTDFGSRGKKLSRVSEGSPRYVRFCYIFLDKKAKQMFSQQHKNNNKRHPSKKLIH